MDSWESGQPGRNALAVQDDAFVATSWGHGDVSSRRHCHCSLHVPYVPQVLSTFLLRSLYFPFLVFLFPLCVLRSFHLLCVPYMFSPSFLRSFVFPVMGTGITCGAFSFAIYSRIFVFLDLLAESWSITDLSQKRGFNRLLFLKFTCVE